MPRGRPQEAGVKRSQGTAWPTQTPKTYKLMAMGYKTYKLEAMGYQRGRRSILCIMYIVIIHIHIFMHIHIHIHIHIQRAALW